jgi:hypothetical protein
MQTRSGNEGFLTALFSASVSLSTPDCPELDRFLLQTQGNAPYGIPLCLYQFESRMHRFLSLVLLTVGLLYTFPAQALAQAQPTPLHITDALQRSPDGQTALKAFQDMREAGFQAFRKSDGSTASVGQVQTFTVRRLTDNQTVSKDFTLTHAEARFNLWMERQTSFSTMSLTIMTRM